MAAMTSSARAIAFGSEPAASKPGAGGLSAAWAAPIKVKMTRSERIMKVFLGLR